MSSFLTGAGKTCLRQYQQISSFEARLFRHDQRSLPGVELGTQGLKSFPTGKGSSPPGHLSFGETQWKAMIDGIRILAHSLLGLHAGKSPSKLDSVIGVKPNAGNLNDPGVLGEPGKTAIATAWRGTNYPAAEAIRRVSSIKEDLARVKS